MKVQLLHIARFGMIGVQEAERPNYSIVSAIHLPGLKDSHYSAEMFTITPISCKLYLLIRDSTGNLMGR
jgi:hypothetical protein